MTDLELQKLRKKLGKSKGKDFICTDLIHHYFLFSRVDITLHHYIAHIICLVGVSYCGLKTYLLMVVTYDMKHGKTTTITDNYYSNLSENIESGCLNHSMVNNDTYPMLDMSSSTRDNYD